MEVFDDLLEEYKSNWKSVADSTDFTAKKFICWGTKTGSTHCYGIFCGLLADKSNAFSSFSTEPLAHKSNAFPSFLTVSQKLKYSCFYNFLITYPEEWIWKLILSQTKMFKIFHGFIQQSCIMKIILLNCIRERAGYLLQNSLWLNRFFCKSCQYKWKDMIDARLWKY